MKDSKGFYKWAQARRASEKLATWAYTALLAPKRSGSSYPLKGSSTMVLQDGTSGLIMPKPKRVRAPKPLTTAAEHVKEYVRVEKALARSIRMAQKFADRVNKETFGTGLPWLAVKLGNAIKDASTLLFRIADTNDARIAKYAVTHLATAAVNLAIDVERLSFREETFPLLQHIARQMPYWATVYSPRPRDQRELNARMAKLGVGIRHQEKFRPIRWSNEGNPAGQLAFRIGDVLSRIHFDRSLKQALCRRGVIKSATHAERRAASQMGFTGNLVSQTKDAKSEDRWEKRLASQGWPRWVVRLHSLPELSPESAAVWFDVGWNALEEAAGGKVTSVPELRALGMTNSGYCDKRQIRIRLRKAFLSRFGSGLVIFGYVTP